jgi:hypothetical protein
MLSSGIRVGLFVTLPVKAVDIATRTVRQWPALGVQAMNGRTPTTSLLKIPDLPEMVRTWDARVRAALSPEALWHAELSGDAEPKGQRRAHVGQEEIPQNGRSSQMNR